MKIKLACSKNYRYFQAATDISVINILFACIEFLRRCYCSIDRTEHNIKADGRILSQNNILH